MKKMSFKEASQIAGLLYGHILGRDSDPDGYRHAIDRLSNGTSVRELVKEFCTADEFRELHIMNESPNELAKKILVIMEKKWRPKPADIKALCIRLVQEDWRAVMSDVINSSAYKAAHGEDGVPHWVA